MILNIIPPPFSVKKCTQIEKEKQLSELISNVILEENRFMKHQIEAKIFFAP